MKKYLIKIYHILCLSCIAVMLMFSIFASKYKITHAVFPVFDTIKAFLAAPEFQQTVDTKITKIKTTKSLIKEMKLDKLAFKLAQRASQKTVNSIIGWANNGFKGKAFYADDYLNILVDSRKVATIKQLTKLKNSGVPLKNQMMRELINQYNNNILPGARDLINSKTLNSKEYQQFIGGQFATRNTKDGKDGWNLLQDITTNPGLNPLAQRLNSINEQNTEAQTTQENAEKEKLAGGGFQDKKECADGVTPTKLADGSKYCPRYAVTTPGRIIEGQLAKALNVPLDRQNNVDEWGELLFQSLTQLTDGLIGVGASKLQTAVRGKINDLTQMATLDASSIITDEPNLYTGALSNGNYQIGQGGDVIKMDEVLGGKPLDTSIPSVIDPEELGALGYTSQSVELYQKGLERLKGVHKEMYKLDSCIPGPNYGWETRMDEYFNKAIKKLEDRKNKDDPKESEIKMFDDLTTQKENFKQIVKLNVLAPASNTSVPSASDFQGTILFGIQLLESKKDIEQALITKRTLKSQLENIRDKWEKAKNNPNVRVNTKKDLIYRVQLLLSEISNSKEDLDEAQQFSSDVDTLITNLSTQIELCKKERRTIYPGKTFGDKYIGDSDFELRNKSLDQFEDVTDVESFIGPLKYLSPAGWFGINASKRSLRETINKFEEVDPELSVQCHNYFFDVWKEADTTTVPLNGEGRSGKFLGIKTTDYKGMLCTDFYFGKDSDYIPRNN